MARLSFLMLLPVSLAPVSAQVRQGGVYQIQADTLNSGGGAASGGNYAVQATLPPLAGNAASASYALSAGYTAQLGGTGGTGAGPAAFLAWQTAIFGGPAEEGAGAQQDPDGDGIVNLLEFAFNLPPTTAGTPLALTGATSGLPWIREEELDGQRYFTMEVIRRKNAGLFQPEVSTTLGNWVPADHLILSGPTSVSGAYERIKFRLGAPIQPGQKVFYRLNVIIQ